MYDDTRFEYIFNILTPDSNKSHFYQAALTNDIFF